MAPDYPDKLLIIFVKNLVKGRVKTRLADSVGERRAADIYSRLLWYTQEIASPVQADKQVWFSDYIPENAGWDSNQFNFRVQEGRDLGDRMDLAFRKGFDEGYTRIALIGSDCAQLSTAILEDAFESLKSSDVVLGPAEDGGYYLVGLNEPADKLFENVPWSTDRVFQITKSKIDKMKLNCSLLPVLNDVDREEDWLQVEEKLRDSKSESA